MQSDSIPKGGWNIFARILQEVLATHGISLGQLDDHPAVYLHKEKVRRLQKSIRENILAFPMLTPDEMDRVIATFHLSELEQLRLRAAVLATAIEIILVDRINKYAALAAAEEILPILERVLGTHAFQEIGIRTITEGVPAKEEADIDTALAGAFSALDRATLALTMSSDADNHWERIDRLHQAEHWFKKALAQLGGATATVKQSESWKLWQDEANHGFSQVTQQLALLEE